MRPLAASNIIGNWGTLLLPIGADDRIDWARLAGELDALIAFRVNGIYTNGTAGEFWSQTEEEFDRLNALVAERCERAGMLFQIGACHTTPQLSLERIRRAREFQPGAIQVILPDWWPPAFDETLAALERFAEAAAPIGLVLYNPPHAKRVLSPVEIGKLKRAVPGIVGVKVADGDDQWYAAMREHVPDLSLFVPGHNLADGLPRGATGSYSNVACLHPGGAQRWFEQMKTEPANAVALGRRIQQFMREQILPYREHHGFSNIALDKLLAAIGGWADIGTRLRWPYRSIPPAEADKLRPFARRLLPELFDHA